MGNALDQYELYAALKYSSPPPQKRNFINILYAYLFVTTVMAISVVHDLFELVQKVQSIGASSVLI